MPVNETKVLDDAALEAASSDRRIWKRRNGSADGTSSLGLLVYDVLYDAGVGLTRDEIVERLVVRLTPHMRGYLEAWYLRTKAQARAKVQRGRRAAVTIGTAIPMVTAEVD